MDNKNSKIVILVSVVFSIALTVAIFDMAEVKTNEKIERTHKDLKYMQKQIDSKSEKQIKDIHLEYIQTLKELNTLLYIEPPRDYLAEWTVLDTIVMTLEDEQVSEYSELVQQKITKLYTQMDEIEQESIISMQLDPILEKKLSTIEKKLYDKYLNSDYETYVGCNAVEFPYIDAEQRKAIPLIDENKAFTEIGALITIAQDVIALGIDNVIVDFVSVTP